MEWQLPIQKMEISNVNIGSPWPSSMKGKEHLLHKPMAPLSYFSSQFRMPFLSIIFPPLPIKEYSETSGRFVLDLFETKLACIKLNTFQETLINAIVYNQMSWFKSEFTKEDVKNGFQQMIQESSLILHCPYTEPHTTGKQTYKNVPLFKNGAWIPFSPNELKVGTRIRVAVKIHGISFLNRNENTEWSGKCRLQHRIVGIIMQNE